MHLATHRVMFTNIGTIQPKPLIYLKSVDIVHSSMCCKTGHRTQYFNTGICCAASGSQCVYSSRTWILYLWLMLLWLSSLHLENYGTKAQYLGNLCRIRWDMRGCFVDATPFLGFPLLCHSRFPLLSAFLIDLL